MKIPQIDMVAQYRTIQKEIDDAVRGVFESGQFIMGPNVKKLEIEIAAYVGVNHGIGVASGTDALILALRALDIGPGDEVIVPSYTFFATAEAVLLVGATPVFIDIDPRTYGIRVDQALSRITSKTRAIIPVHLYGHAAGIEELVEGARAKGVRVIEDNAQALGATCNGKKTGSFGDIGCLSFFPSKNLGACGDAGMVLTNDAAIADRVRILRSHGWKEKYRPIVVGMNSRLDEIQAAILRAKLRHLDSWNERRRELAADYAARLSSLDVVVPVESPGFRHVYHVYVLRVPRRDEVEKRLAAEGIGCAVYYPQPLHRLEPCLHLGYGEGSLPFAEAASRETMAVPLYPEMTAEHIDAVADALGRALRETRGTA
jgi:dTDP-4-amino-4,6-dideoxygalactose transaminase